MNAIELDDVTKRYGSVTALEGVTLSVEHGRTVGLLGTNGAGKTTLFRHLVGHETPDSGRIEVAGRSPEAGSAVRERVGYLPERPGFDDALTAREVLAFHAELRGVPAAERDRRVERVLATVGLSEAADRPTGGFSKGMTRRLGLGTVLVGTPSVLLLDEPTAGLDPRGVETFHDVVETLAAGSEVTVVFSSHALAEVEQLCDDVLLLDDGRVRVHGPVDDLRLADGRVTVALRLADPGDAGRAGEAARTVGGVRGIEPGRDGRRLRIDCERTAAFDVLATVRETVDLGGFEVREPDLREVFGRHVPTAGSGGGAP
jgi:Cu-processing system ATP-binding protein